MTTATRSAAARQDRFHAPKPVVFVVDDDLATRGLLGEVAEEFGWAVRRFSRLAALRSAIVDAPPSLLILDDDLPDGRGGDLARELREHPRLSHVPVLVCTAAQPMRRAEIGAWAPVVSKPFDLAEIERFLATAHPTRGSRSRDNRAG